MKTWMWISIIVVVAVAAMAGGAAYANRKYTDKVPADADKDKYTTVYKKK